MNQTYFPNYGYSPGYAPQGRPVGYGVPAWYPAPQMQNPTPAPVSAPSVSGFVVQPVARKEEALAVIADPMSAGVLMPDLDHGVIYVKRFNANTGASDFAEFLLPAASQVPKETPEPEVEYVTLEEFRKVVEPLAKEVAALRKRGKQYDDE